MSDGHKLLSTIDTGISTLQQRLDEMMLIDPTVKVVSDPPPPPPTSIIDPFEDIDISTETYWQSQPCLDKPVTFECLKENLRNFLNRPVKFEPEEYKVVSWKVFEHISYVCACFTLWETNGYRKIVGPDQKEWIEDRYGKSTRAGVRYGKGNRAVRRSRDHK